MFSCHGQVRYVKRVFMPSTGQPARIQWKRRPLYVDAVESNSRGDYTDCVYCVFHLIV